MGKFFWYVFVAGIAAFVLYYAWTRILAPMVIPILEGTLP